MKHVLSNNIIMFNIAISQLPLEDLVLPLEEFQSAGPASDSCNQNFLHYTGIVVDHFVITAGVNASHPEIECKS